MSLKRAAYHSVTVANNALGGAKKTRSDRLGSGRDFIDYCLKKGWPIADIRHGNAEQLKGWIEQHKLLGNTTATINNKVSRVRALISARGVDLVQAGIADSTALGLSKRDRSGTKLPITDAVFESALAKALELKEPGFVHAIKLERFLGLRGLEALMSTHQLKIYANQAKTVLQEIKEGVSIKDGTKGGRQRWAQTLRA